MSLFGKNQQNPLNQLSNPQQAISAQHALTRQALGSGPYVEVKGPFTVQQGSELQTLMDLKVQQMQQMRQMIGGGMNAHTLAGAGTSVLLPEEVCVQAIVGWRRWSVTMFGETLLSNNGTPWEPFLKLGAICLGGVRCKGVVCECGIYAYKTRQQAEKLDNAPEKVTHLWGEVSLWGRVIEHSKGYRAQFAYPKAFVNTGGIAQRMAYLYGVPVIP
jgi:hypothetical protein